MKRTLRMSIMLSVICASLLSCQLGAVAADAKEVNLIKNPGFEEFDKAGNPIGWFRVNNTGAAPSDKDCFMVDKTTYSVPPFKGGNTGRMVTETPVSGSSGLCQNKIPVEGNTAYNIGMRYIQTKGYVRNMYVCVRQYDEAGKDITGNGFYFATNVAPSTEWTAWSRKYTTKPETREISIVIYPNGQGSAWFDDMSLTKAAD